MKALVYEGPGNGLTLGEIERPEPGPGELVLRVTACGICGSDMHVAQAGLVSPGTVFGHEFAGEVTGVGTGCEDAWQLGDRAVSLGAFVCQECPACLTGTHSLCAKAEYIGYSMDRPGAYAEYVKVQAPLAVKLPGTVTSVEGAAIEPLAVGLNALRSGRVGVGDAVLIIGAGPIGVACVKWAQFFGATHIGVSERVPSRLERALRAGATAAIDAGLHPDPVAAFQQATGRSPKVIFECVGRPILQHLFEVAPLGCHIVNVGAAMEPEPIVPAVASRKGITVTFSIGYSLEDFRAIVQLLGAGRLTVDPLVTARVPLDQGPQLFAALQKPNDHCKVILEP